MAEGKLFPDLIFSFLNIGAGGVNELLLIGVFDLRAVQPWQALTGPRWAVLLPGLAAPDVLHFGSCSTWASGSTDPTLWLACASHHICPVPCSATLSKDWS